MELICSVPEVQCLEFCKAIETVGKESEQELTVLFAYIDSIIGKSSVFRFSPVDIKGCRTWIFKGRYNIFLY